jgi:hypothetical protein
MKVFNIRRNKIIVIMTILFLGGFASCKKFVDIDGPVNRISSADVYKNDATAAAVLTGIYGGMSQSSIGSGELAIFLPFYTGLSSDELVPYDINNETYRLYFQNDLTSVTLQPWNNCYSIIYFANSAIEGLNSSSSLSPAVKQQLLGEAKFVRAFIYFHLVNFYGDVPLAVTSDYAKNSILPRTPKANVWNQIITDLKESQTLLNNNYLDGTVQNATMERVRPNKWAATALLARAYLYTGDYVNADIQSSNIINNSAMYSIVGLDDVFLKNSKEAIWQLQSIASGRNTTEGQIFILPPNGPDDSHPFYIADNLIQSFEAGDNRKTSWLNSVTFNNQTYFYPFKYKISAIDAPITEYSMVLRLSEQYLIRAEAKAQENDLNASQLDLNFIRNRAGLSNTLADSKITLLQAIEHERQVELFTEGGHRWFDLKRTSSADRVLSPIKGSNWQNSDQLYPIPQDDIDKNPSLTGHQNAGY